MNTRSAPRERGGEGKMPRPSAGFPLDEGEQPRSEAFPFGSTAHGGARGAGARSPVGTSSKAARWGPVHLRVTSAIVHRATLVRGFSPLLISVELDTHTASQESTVSHDAHPRIDISAQAKDFSGRKYSKPRASKKSKDFPSLAFRLLPSERRLAVQECRVCLSRSPPFFRRRRARERKLR